MHLLGRSGLAAGDHAGRAINAILAILGLAFKRNSLIRARNPEGAVRSAEAQERLGSAAAKARILNRRDSPKSRGSICVTTLPFFCWARSALRLRGECNNGLPTVPVGMAERQLAGLMSWSRRFESCSGKLASRRRPWCANPRVNRHRRARIAAAPTTSLIRRVCN